jgi:Ca2+-binding RTX toxin-like protein
MPAIPVAFGGSMWSNGLLDRFDKGGGISNWVEPYGSALIELPNEFGDLVRFVYTGIAGGNQINIGSHRFDFSPLPADTVFADTAAIGLARPQDMLRVTIGDDTFLVVASRGDWAITSLKVDPGGADAGTLTHVSTVTDPDLTDIRSPLRDVTDLGVLQVAGRTFVVAQSAIYGDISLWRMSPGGTLSLRDHKFGLGTTGSPHSRLAQVETGVLGDAGFVFGLDGSGALAAYAVDGGAGTLTLRDTNPAPAGTNGFITLATASFNGKIFVYSGPNYDPNGNGPVFMTAFDGVAFSDPVALTGAGKGIRFMRVFDIEGAKVLLVSDAFGLDNRVGLFVVQPDGSLVRMASVAVPGAGFFALRSADLALVDGVSEAGVLQLTASVTAVGVGTGASYIFDVDESNDTHTGNGAANTLLATFGDDTLKGQGGDDWLFGGTGDDELRGGTGNDVIAGGRGADVLRGDIGVDMLSYETSRAGVVIDLGARTASSGDAEGDDFQSFEGVTGSRFGDTLTGTDTANLIVGGRGSDAVHGKGGADTIIGGEPDRAENEADVLFGGGGDDRLVTRGGNDSLFGGTGNDTIIAAGGPSNDAIFGGNGADNLRGGRGNDAVFGGAGNDTLFAGPGQDTLTGGANADRFTFFVDAAYTGRDVVEDFQVGLDRIDILGPGFDTFAEIMAVTRQLRDGTLIDLPGSGDVFLVGIDRDDLVAASFVL